MGFYKSKNLGNGSKLNIGKKSVGVSTGAKGARVSLKSKGRAGISLSIPGTGIRYRKSIKIGNGGLISGICNFMIGIFQITVLLAWWLLKLVFWLMYIMIVYTCRGIAFVFRKIVSKFRKTETTGE